MLAREWFGQVRSETVRLRATWESLQAMRAHAALGAQSYGDNRSPGFIQGDELERIVDLSAEFDERQRMVDALKKDAERVLFGPRHRCGIARLKGKRYAEAMSLRYIHACTWSEVAYKMGVSKRWCQRLCELACAYIDRVGWAYIESENELEEDWLGQCRDDV